MLGDVSGSERSEDYRDGADNIPKRAQPPGHELLLAHQGHQSLIGCRDESGRQHHRQHPDQQSPVGEAGQRHPDERNRGERREDQEEAAVPQSKRVPEIARQAENEGKVHRDAHHQPEHRDLRRGRVQLVLQHVRRLDIDQVAAGRSQIDEQRQPPEVEEGPGGRRGVVIDGGAYRFASNQL